jgi:hypothetical protein
MGNTNHLDETNACRAYIDKLAYFGNTFSPGKLIISASAGGYDNGRYCFDTTPAANDGVGSLSAIARDAVIASGVALSNVLYRAVEPHISRGTNVAGYCSRGIHGWQDTDSTVNGDVVFVGDSSWFIMMTGESFNGMRFWENHGHGTYLHWFSVTAFGGTNFINTPVGAVSHTYEPNFLGDGENNPALYFGYWVTGKTFGYAAWFSKRVKYFQAVGDPFVRR